LQARAVLDAGSRARRRDTFLCSAKEKYPKERRPGGLPATRVPCASRENRRLLNSRSRCARPLKHTQASSGFHCHARLRLRGSRSTPPVALTEYRSQSGIKTHTMFEVVYGAKPRKAPSCARPPDWRGTQGTGVAGECSGGPSLWVLSLGQARESTSPCGRESPH